MRSQLEEQSSRLGLDPYVEFLGRISDEQLPLCYGASNCFVLPTRALECFGLIVLESFATETPVIASRVAAIPELVSVQGESWLFEPGNAQQLADRMLRFLGQELKGPAGLRNFASQFDKPLILQKWEQLLFQLRQKT